MMNFLRKIKDFFLGKKDNNFLPRDGIEFEYINSLGSFMTIKLLTKPYKGVVYSYSYISMNPELDDLGRAILKFEFNVLEDPNNDPLGLEDDKEFHRYIGDVLQSIIIDAATNDSLYDVKYKTTETE